MKAFKVLAICALMAVSTQSFANTVPIKFAKGSSCGSFSGNPKGKVFSLYLKAGQIFGVETQSGYARALYPDGKWHNPMPVTNPDLSQFETTVNGLYKIKIVSPDNYADIQFCAY